MFGKNNLKEQLVSIYVQSYIENFNLGEVNKRMLIKKVQPFIYSTIDHLQLKDNDMQSVEKLGMCGSALLLKNGWYLSFVPDIEGNIDFVGFSQIYPNTVTNKQDFFSIKYKENRIPKVAGELTDTNSNQMCVYRFYTGDVGSKKDNDHIFTVSCYYSKHSYENYLADKEYAIPVDNEKLFFDLVIGGARALENLINNYKKENKDSNYHK